MVALEYEELPRLHKCLLGLTCESLEDLCKSQRPRINDVDSHGCTALHWAVKLGQMDAVRRILMCGGDPNVFDSDGATALHLACGTGSSDCTALLVDAGAEAEARDRFGASPLLYACSKGNLATVKYMLKRGANTEAMNAVGETAIFYARTAGKSVLQCLIEHGADLNHVDGWGYSPILDAAFDGFFNALEFHLSQRADLTIRLSDGKSLLHIAARATDLGIVELLLNHDLSVIDPALVDDAGYSAEQYARERTDAPNISRAFEVLLAKITMMRELHIPAHGGPSHEHATH